MREKMNKHKLEMEAFLNKADDLEEKKKEDLLAYDKKNKRGLTS